MESENRQSGILIAIAALSVVLGAIALIVAFNAKSASDDAADQASVAAVSAKLSRLSAHLGVAESDLSSRERAQAGSDAKTRRAARRAAAGLSARIGAVEEELVSLRKGNMKATEYGKRITALENQVTTLESNLASTNQRISRMQRQNADGGSSAAP